MLPLAVIAAVLAGLGHVVAFVLESFLFDRPQVQRFLLGRTESAPGVRLWTFNQGFYNLFLAVGAFVGVALWLADRATVGQTLIVFCCGAMALAGLVLYISDRRLWRGAISQSLPPAVAVIATLAA
jgi:putative membrane protein